MSIIDDQGNGNHRRRVRELVSQKVNDVNGSPIALEDSDSVLLSGLLNSLSIVELILTLETEFGLDITAAEVRIEDFDSVEEICALLDRQLPSSAP